MARALSGEKVYPFVILSVCVSLVLSRGRARLRAENLFARPLAVPCLWRAPPPPPVSVGRCWTEESPGEFVQSEPKGSSRRMCQTQRISHHRGLQATQVPRRRRTDGNKQTNKKGGVPRDRRGGTRCGESANQNGPSTAKILRERRRGKVWLRFLLGGWVVLKTPILVSVVDFVFFFGSFLKKFAAFGLALPLARQLEWGQKT